ncbi:WYL domain-containing protein [Virgibacillus oceani]
MYSEDPIKTENQNAGKWIPATLRFNDKQEAIEFILGFGNKINVISPKDLPNEVVASAIAVIDFYKNK